MSRKFIDMDANGIATYGHFDSDGNIEALEYIDDVESILESNLASRNDGTNGYSQSREWKKEASIPIALLSKWEVERGMPQGFLMTREGFDVLLKIIKDPDYGKLRTDK